MKATVIEVFIDKYTQQVYAVGDIVDIADKDRLKDLTDRKLVRVAEEVAVKQKPATKRKKVSDNNA